MFKYEFLMFLRHYQTYWSAPDTIISDLAYDDKNIIKNWELNSAKFSKMYFGFFLNMPNICEIKNVVIK